MSQPLLLQLVGAQLVEQADAPAFLGHVEQHAPAFLLDAFQAACQLLAAVAAHGIEHVAGQALRVHAHEHVLLAGDVALDQGQMLLVVEQALVAVGDEIPQLRGHLHDGHRPHQLLVAPPVADEVGHGDHLQAVVPAVRRSGRAPGPWCRRRS